MAGYSGWGGSAELFDEERGGEWGELRARLQSALSEERYAEARASTLTAFYTPQAVVDAMWGALGRMGVGGGDAFLEPGCGTGNFIRRAPEGAAAFGVEVDPTSAEIAKALSPDASIAAAALEDCYVPDGSFGAVVGNVPYSGDIKIEGKPIHDWFIAKSLAAVRPGGAVCLLTSAWTLDKASSASRVAMARQAELVCAVRLPSETFERQAGTSVVSDVLLLRKRSAPISPEAAAEETWTQVAELDQGVLVNRIFMSGEGQGAVVGELSVGPGRFGPAMRVTSGLSADEIGDALAERLSRAAQSVGDVHEGMAPALAQPACAPLPADPAPYELTLGEGGEIWWSNGDTSVPMRPVGKDGASRVAGMVELRDLTRKTLELEGRAGVDERSVDAAIGALKAAYDAFVSKWGRISDPRNLRALNQKEFLDTSLSANLFNLERTDGRGRFLEEAAVLERRVIDPRPPYPETASSLDEAVAVSLDRYGYLDEGYMEGLLGIEEGKLPDLAGEKLVLDPSSGELVTEADFLSGDLNEKISVIKSRLIDGPLAADAAAFERAWAERRGWSDEGAADCAPVEAFLAQERVALSDKASAASDVDSFASVSSSLWEIAAVSYRKFGDRAVLAAVEDFATRSASHSSGPYLAQDMYRALLNTSLVSGCEHAADWVRAREAALRAMPHRKIGSITISETLGECLIRGDLDAAIAVTTGRYSCDRPVELVIARAALAVDPACLSPHGTYASKIDEDAVARCEPYLEDVLRRVGGQGLGEVLANLTPEGFDEYERAREQADEAWAPRRAEAYETAAHGRELVSRLEAALPPRLGPEEIDCGLGASWVPAVVVAQFAVEQFCGSLGTARERAKVHVTHLPDDDSWRVEAPGSIATVAAWEEYGCGAFNPFQLLERSLNGTSPNVTVEGPDGKRKTDPVATREAWDAKGRLEKRFREWVWENPNRAAALCRVYNDRFNSTVNREYDGSRMTFPGMSPSVELRPHQADAVARCVQSKEGTLLAHVVGAGKTFTMAAAVMEARRLGLATKPVVAVPNHLTEQWAAEFLELYPTSKVLCMNVADMGGKEAVRRFWGAARAGDWDAVIVAQSRFEQLSVSRERREAALERRIDELTATLKERDSLENKKSWGTKKLEGTRKRLEERLKRLRSEPGIEGITFEDVGFDMLVVDEAHNYKNLGVEGGGLGMSVAPARKCEDMLEKCDLLRDGGHGRNIIFATGTPVSNSMAELYNMERYLAPKLLERQGTLNFAAWAKTFGELEDSFEPRPEGRGFQIKRRFARFHNLPELVGAFRECADVKTADDLDLPVPAVDSVSVKVAASPEQERCVDELVERADRVRKGSVAPEEDNMLAITSDGRKVALDPKLLDRDGERVPLAGGKVQACAENVAKLYFSGEDVRSAQLVFCDSSTAKKGSGDWNVHADLKRRLVELGVPAEEVAFVSDAGDDPKKREALFEKVRRGEVRVLIGSTQKLGTGTNVQDRLAAIHDLDCPWRPADLEQRLGRVQRQGNMFSVVKDFRYVTEGTFDSYLYQVVSRKQRFISQVFTSKRPSRTVEDADRVLLDFQSLAELASGDANVKRYLEVQNKVATLRLERSAWAEKRRRLEDSVAVKLEPRARSLREEAAALEAQEQGIRSCVLGGAGAAAAVLDGAVPLERPQAARTLFDRVSALAPGAREKVGSYRGLDLWAWKKPAGRSGGEEMCLRLLTIAPRGGEPFFPSSSPTCGATANTFNALDRLIEQVTDGVPSLKDEAGRAEDELAQARARLGEPFAGQEELEAAEAELARLKEAEDGHEGDNPAGSGNDSSGTLACVGGIEGCGVTNDELVVEACLLDGPAEPLDEWR